MLSLGLVVGCCLTARPPPFLPSGITFNASAPRPNILILLIDDMGYSDLGVFGRKNVSTPNIDKLVDSGIKFTQWISAAPICTPSRAALQTGRYPIRTGCMGDVEKFRVIPTPSNPHGLDPSRQMSLATALKFAGYRTGMSGKWHLGINGDGQDRRFTPNAHSYETYVGAPWTNAPMCAMDSDGISNKYSTGQTFCFLTANDTVIQQPLHVENFTATITDHALSFIESRSLQPSIPWYFLMSYFHVHTPLFTNRTNRGRSRGGRFGDNVEELDDSVGAIIGALDEHEFRNNTLIFLTSDNGPYQEEGWDNAGRTTVFGSNGLPIGRLKGGKGQVFEGGIRMPGSAVWYGRISPGIITDIFVSTMDIFPTALALAGINIPSSYPVDGRDMTPVLLDSAKVTQHEVFLHYCGFNIPAARVDGRWKVFWAVQKWYTHDPANASICTECCNGINPASRVFAPATQLCGCTNGSALVWLDSPIVYDMTTDIMELHPLNDSSWPSSSNTTFSEVVSKADTVRSSMIQAVHPKPNKAGAGVCTSGLPAADRQPCCVGCSQRLAAFGKCVRGIDEECSCNI